MWNHRAKVVSIALCITTLASVASAQTKRPVKAKPAPGTIGTKQMVGGEGQIGTTYSFERSADFPRFNFTLSSAAYSVDQIPHKEGSFTPKKDEKLLLLRYRIQNPTKADIKVPATYFAQVTFQAVATDNKTYGADRTPYALLEGGRPAEKPYLFADLVLKPGQKSEGLLAAIIIPADESIPKLVVRRGRVGTKQQVTRFDLRGKVAPLPPPVADPADPTGATARTEVPAKIGDTCIGAFSDFKVESLTYVTDAIGDVAPPDGGRILAVTASATYGNGIPLTMFTTEDKITGYLKDGDGEKILAVEEIYKATRPEPALVEPHNYGDTVRFRVLFKLPSGVNAQKLYLRNDSYFEGGPKEGREYVFDLTGAK